MFDVIPCKVSEECRWGPEQLGDLSSCLRCQWADDNGGNENRWRPSQPGKKHPKMIQKKISEKIERTLQKAKKKASIDPNRQYYSRRAAGAEKKTNQIKGVSIKATRNSGRSLHDADHLLTCNSALNLINITLDTKLQSQTDHPKVDLFELDKVRSDAANARSAAGGLLIRNRLGRGVVVFAEEDLPVLFPKE